MESPERVDESPVPSTSSAIVADRPRKNVVVLKTRVEGPFGSEQTIYLCGTSHISRKSCEAVKELIQAVKPQVVMLELCDERRNILVPQQTVQNATSLSEHLAIWRKGQVPLFTLMYSWMLSTLAEKCEVAPGEEFRIALGEASKIGSAVSLGDRRVSITVARTWAALSRWQRIKILFDILIGGLFNSGKDLTELLDSLAEDEDALTVVLKELGSTYPGLLRPLIEERDEFMVLSLRCLAREANKIVAVVGAGHLKGIQEKWDSEIDMEAITAIPAAEKPLLPSWTHVILLASGASVVLASVVLAVRWRRLS